MSSAEFTGPDEGSSRYRKDLPASPAEGAGGAAAGRPQLGQGDRSELVPDVRHDGGKPVPGKPGRDALIPSISNDISPLVPQVPPAGEQPAQGGPHKDKAQEDHREGNPQGTEARTTQEGVIGETPDARPTTRAGEGSGFGNGPGDRDRKITGGHNEPDPDAPDDTVDDADAWLRGLTESGFAGAVLFEDKHKDEEEKSPPPDAEASEKETVRLPADFTALVSEIEENRGRLQEFSPSAVSQDVTMTRREAEDEGKGDSEARERARSTTEGAVHDMERFALDLVEKKAIEWWGEYDVRKEVYIPMQTADQDGGVRIHIKPKDTTEQTEETTPQLTWQNGVPTSDVDRRLVIETVRRDVQYDDPQNSGPQTATIGTVLQYDLLANGEVQFVGMGLKYLDERDLPNDDEADRVLDVYRKPANQHGITGEEADDIFTVSRTLAELVTTYPAYKEMFEKGDLLETGEKKKVNIVITTDDQGEFGQEAATQISERDLAIKAEREGIIATIRELMAGQNAESFTAEAVTTGDAVIAMMELNAQLEKAAPKATTEYETIEDELAALTASAPKEEQDAVSDFVEGLEDLPNVPRKTHARAYLIDGAIFQSNDSQIKLHAMLAQEKQMRLDPRNAGDENVEVRAPDLLDAVIKESATLGIDPQDLIKYAVDDDEAWRLRAYYYNMVRLTGKEEDPRLDAHLLSLTDRRKTSTELAYKYTDVALEASDNAALNIALMQQFPESAGRTEITVHNVDKLFKVAQQVLLSTTAEMLLDEGNITVVKGGEISELESEKKTLVGKFDELIDDARRSPKGEYDDRPALIHALREGQFTWRMSLKAIKGDAAEDIVDAVKEEEGLRGIDRNAVLDTVAIQFAAHGDFESAQKILAHIFYEKNDSSVIESAYINVWNRATSIADLLQVAPTDQHTGAPISPLLSADYISVGALVSGNTSIMRNVALDIASDLQKVGTTEQELAHREQQLNMLEQFIKRTQAVAGKEDRQKGIDEAVALSRELFAVFTKEGTADIEEIAPIIDVLAKNGNVGDWRNIQRLIDQQPISAIEKIKLYAKFASAIE